MEAAMELENGSLSKSLRSLPTSLRHKSEIQLLVALVRCRLEIL